MPHVLKPSEIDAIRSEARNARAANNNSLAIEILERAMARDPNNIVLLKDLSNFRAAEGDDQGVIDALDRVRAQEELGDHTKKLYARSKANLEERPFRDALEAGKLDIAQVLLAELIRKRPDDVRLLKDLANVKAREGDDEGVIDALDRVRAREELGDHAAKLYSRAKANVEERPLREALKAGTLGTARAMLESLLETRPDDVRLLKDLGNTCFKLEDFDCALGALGRASALEPLGDYSTVLFARTELRVGNIEHARELLEPFKDSSSPYAPALFHLAQVYGRIGDLNEAKAMLRALTEDRVEDRRKWQMAANGYMDIRDYESALGVWDKCEELGLRSDRSRVIHGRAALRAGKLARAEEILSVGLDASSSPFNQLFFLYESRLKAKKLQQARETAAELVSLEPSTFAEWLTFGRVLRQLGEFEKAVSALETAATMGADAFLVSQEIADCDMRRGLLTPAGERVRALLNEQPDNPRSHFILGVVNVKLGKYDEGRKHFERVAELQPDQASAYRELASIALHDGRADDAAQLLKRGLELEPNSGSMNAEIAAIFLEKGRYDEARKHAEKSLEIEPDKMAAKLVLTNLAIFEDNTAERPAIAVICEPAQSDGIRVLDPDAEVYEAGIAAFVDAKASSSADWVVFGDVGLDRDEYASMLQRMRGASGAVINHETELAAVRAPLLRDVLRAFDGKAMSPAEVKGLVQKCGREVYPRFSGNGGEKNYGPIALSGEVFLISSSGHNLFGGAEHFLRGLAKIYAALGFDPVIVGHRAEENGDGVTSDGIRYVEFREDADDDFRKFLIQRQPALAHVVTGSGFFMMQVAQDLDIPFVYGTHFWREMLRGSGWYPDIDQVASPKRDFRTLLMRYESVYVNSIYTLGMQYEHHALTSGIMYSLPSTPSIPATQDGRDIALLVNARPEKGFDLLLEVAAENPDIKFVAIASQSNDEDALAAVKQAGVSNVEIIGRVDDMEAIYSRAWCVLVPSYKFIETFSRVTIEAQRHGVPVIGSNRGNVPVLLENSGVSLPEDAAAWSAELRHLAEDPAYWAERSSAATENSERYSFSMQRPILEGLARQAMRPVLVAVGNGIGNILQCTPAIRRLSEFLGQPVDIVINQDFPGCEWLLAGSPHVGMVFGSDTEYVRRRYELVIVLASFGKTVPLFNSKQTFIARQKMPFEMTETMHESKYNLDCLVAAEIGFEYSEEDIAEYFVGALTPTGLSSRHIVLHSGGKAGEWEVKRWPYFQELAEELASRGWEIISVGSPEEYVEGTIDRTGTPLRESLATIQEAAYMIANDSGLMHVADGMGVPLTTIFGPTSVVKNGPLAPNSQVIALDKYCAPCQFNERFRTCKCIGEISLDSVLEKVLAHLETLGRDRQ